ncbi:hypothetical protein Q7P37_003593 [Cladosporium fusiforme]
MHIQIPHLRETQSSKQLVVNGQPFLMRAGELQNSSFTSSKYMAEAYPKLTEANLNTVLGCVTWEQVEPEEGKFDFTEFDKCLHEARKYDIRMVILWFGSFKNGISTYAPPWVKTDIKRFPRAKLRKAGGELAISEALSIFHTEAQAADARAFGRLMAHIKEVDEQYSTVIMMQVENETGLLGDSRDGAAAAEKRFNSPVPAQLIEALAVDKDKLRPELTWALERVHKTSCGTWPEVFGRGHRTDELFMAYHYSLYLEQVASAGKKSYPIPFYANVWQNYNDDDADNDFPVVVGGGDNPGDYPSGGGVVNVLDIWKAFAPSLDMISPDVYLNDYESSCAKYRHRNQPLFIPEQRRDEYGARRMWAAIGSYQCLGAAPFGIETLEPDVNPFKRHYGLMAQMSSQILQAQRDLSSIGFFFDELPTHADAKDPSPPRKVKFGPWSLTIERSFVFGHPSPGFGMVIYQGGAKFMFIGAGFQVTFKHESALFTGILKFEEKEVQPDGSLKTLRMLNGDETRSGQFCIMPSDDPDYGGFPICVTIPARTMIAEAEPYFLEDHD